MWMPNVPLPDGWKVEGGIEACVFCGNGTSARDAAGNPAHVRCLPPEKKAGTRKHCEPGNDPGGAGKLA